LHKEYQYLQNQVTSNLDVEKLKSKSLEELVDIFEKSKNLKVLEVIKQKFLQLSYEKRVDFLTTHQNSEVFNYLSAYVLYTIQTQQQYELLKKSF